MLGGVGILALQPICFEQLMSHDVSLASDSRYCTYLQELFMVLFRLNLVILLRKSEAKAGEMPDCLLLAEILRTICIIGYI